MTLSRRSFLYAAAFISAAGFAPPPQPLLAKRGRRLDRFVGVVEAGQSFIAPPDCVLAFDLTTLPFDSGFLFEWRVANLANRLLLIIAPDGGAEIYERANNTQDTKAAFSLTSGKIEIVNVGNRVEVWQGPELRASFTCDPANVGNTQGVYHASAGAIISDLKVYEYELS